MEVQISIRVIALRIAAKFGRCREGDILIQGETEIRRVKESGEAVPFRFRGQFVIPGDRQW